MLERALLIVTIAGGAAAGLLWPTYGSKPAAAPDSIEVTLQRSSDRHFYAEAEINGKPVRFLVDTGASEIALTEEDAAKAGIAVDPARYELLGQGASGIVRGQYVELKRLKLDGIAQEDAKAVVIQGATISLLGQPFLEDVDEIVIRKGEMILRDRKDS
jgi:aspartyl protease family protein